MDIYGRLVEELGKYGKVLSPFVADKNMTEDSPHEGEAIQGLFFLFTVKMCLQSWNKKKRKCLMKLI